MSAPLTRAMISWRLAKPLLFAFALGQVGIGCVTDGERVIAFFGAGGLHCFDNDGERVWSKELGTFPGGWGVGASPIIFNETVIQNCDAEGESYLIALNRKTGDVVWRTPREAKPRGGWSTPIVINVNGQPELILNGEFGVSAYNPSTGEPLWNCTGFNGRGTPAPVWGHGMLYVVNGKSGDVYAVKPGGRGDVTKTHLLWKHPTKHTDHIVSPLVVGKRMLLIKGGGIATCFDTQAGKPVWKPRRIQATGEYFASPIYGDGKIYVAGENGFVVVLNNDGQELKILSKNDMGDAIIGTPAISDGQLIVRTRSRLYCISEE